MPALHIKQIKLHLQAIPNWSKRAKTILRTFKFEGFLNGVEFVNRMIKAHQKDARAFKAESAATQDADIKNFLDKSIPVVEAHLKIIMAMKK